VVTRLALRQNSRLRQALFVRKHQTTMMDMDGDFLYSFSNHHFLFTQLSLLLDYLFTQADAFRVHATSFVLRLVSG
jgi:hypothetical protein